MRRRPAVAGHFYQGTAEALKQQVTGFLVPVADKVRALGIVSPHAGLMYSGAVAGAVYSTFPFRNASSLSARIIPDWELRFLSCPKAPGKLRSAVSLSIQPLPGPSCPGPRTSMEDTLAHLHEHSLEVQLPFIQYFKKEFSIVPIQMLDTRLETCLEVGRAVADAIAEESANVLIVASSDMSHYEQAAVARKKDFLAIKHILDRDPEGLYRTVKEEGITMCGYGPVVTMLTACKLLGASRSDLIKYSNSGDVSGDFDQVVGYAGLVVS